MRRRLHADIPHDAPNRRLQLADVERFGHERGATVTLRHQLVIDCGYEQERNAEFRQAISHREDHAVAKLDIEHGAVESLIVQQPQRIEHAVGMCHLVACVLQRLFHQRSQVELVFHQQQVASALAHSGLHTCTPVLSWELQSVLCCINAMRVHCQPGAKPPRARRQPGGGGVEGALDFVDGVLARAVDTAAVPRIGDSVMPLSGTDSVAPGVLRVECMPLDCGGAAIVVELDRAPERAWMKSLKRALLADDAMEGAQAKFDGRFVYVVGVDGGGHRAQHRVMQAVMAAGGACASNARRERPAAGVGVSSAMAT